MKEHVVEVGHDRPTDGVEAAGRKRAAVELVREHDRKLRWTARRFSICAEDAEDAYQRGIEILLSKAPTTEIRQLLPWTRTVIKHEALAIRKTRERTLGHPGPPASGEQGEEDWVQLIPSTGDGPDELTVKRERIARSREALALLKPAELKALTQLAEGFSYAEIGELNDWTRTKVNRCLAEGRARFRSAFRESEQGELCAGFEPLISAGCDGELDAGESERLANHLAACGHCRSTLRAYRAAPRAAAALAPAMPFAHGLWDRVQELAVSAQIRLSGIGRGADSAQGALASGGTRGAGMAAAAKLAAICAGTAGTAAVCVATGVVPATDLIHGHRDAPVVEQAAQPPSPAPSRELETPEETAPIGQGTTSQGGGEAQTGSKPRDEPAESIPAVPEPTATESEFTPEAAGTPVPASAPPPPAKPASKPVPTGNGGGEFAP